MKFDEKEILEQLDLAFTGKPSKYYPTGRPQDIKYNFFIDLEHGYFAMAGNRIHLYADSTRWAIVFEKNGYQNRGTVAEIELNYFGNCINYPVDEYPERNYITNSSNINLIDYKEFERIENKEGEEDEKFEFISRDVKEIKVRDRLVPFENDYKKYENLGIKISDADNPRKLIGFVELVRYLQETNPELISASNEEIRRNIPKDLPKLMTIDEYHFISAYKKTIAPSKQETYKLIAKVLVTQHIENWKPTLEPNNHWRNWESGNL